MSTFDEALEASWGRFEAELLRRLMSLGDGFLIISTGPPLDDGASPYVQFASSPGEVRGEVSSNRYLGSGSKLTRADHQALRALGWIAPGRGTANSNWHIDVDLDIAPLLTGMAVATLRQVLGVISPDFLLRDDDQPEVEAEEAERFVLGCAESPEQLMEMVSQILVERGQEAAEPDGDGDLFVEGPRGFCWVQARRDLPAVTFWGTVLSDVTNLQQALLEINVLNRRVPFVRFSLSGDTILFHSDLGAVPLVADQFDARVDFLFARIPEIALDLDETVNGLKQARKIPPRPHRDSA